MLRGCREGHERDDGAEGWSDHKMSILAVGVGGLLHPGGETEYDCNHMLPSPFDTLDANFLSHLRCAQGDHVFRQGDPTKGIFFVKSGNVCLTRVTESGNAVTMYNARAGDVFAEASIYSDHYHCDAVCSAPSEVVRVSKRAILSRLREDTAFSEGITKRLAMQVQDYRQLLTLHAV